MLIKSYAKINLTLEIGKKLNSGYHEIQSVMQQIDLYDALSFKKLKENKIILECSKKELENENNIAYKAALLLENRFNINKGVEINIKKSIPIGAGLAGGSGNAAATLKAMNKLFDLNLDENKLIKIGKELGSDVPFQIVGGTALVTGTGEKLKKLRNLGSINIVLINPDISISTKWAYEAFDLSKKTKTEDKNKKIIKAIEDKNIKEIAKNLFNDFEPAIIKKYPIIKDIKQNLIKEGALNSLMSGSGSTVFGIFESTGGAKKAFENLKNKYLFVYLTKTR